MPNTNSAKKALRQTKKLTAKNSAEKKPIIVAMIATDQVAVPIPIQ